jgi:hypothetical protein
MNDQTPTTNKGAIYIVLVTLSLNATIGVVTLAASLYFNRELNQGLMTAFVGIVTGLLGVIGGMLVKTSPTESTQNGQAQSAQTDPAK